MQPLTIRLTLLLGHCVVGTVKEETMGLYQFYVNQLKEAIQAKLLCAEHAFWRSLNFLVMHLPSGPALGITPFYPNYSYRGIAIGDM